MMKLHIGALAVLSGVLSSAAWAQPEIVGQEAVFNVTAYGACPDDSTPDDAQVQAAVNAATAYVASTVPCVSGGVRRAVVFFPKGRYHFNLGVLFSGVYALDIRGAGHFPLQNPGGFQGAATFLQSDNGVSIFKISGCSTLRFEHLMTTGLTTSTQPLVIIDSPVGFGTGSLSFKNMTFSNAGIGVGTSTSNNNSEFFFEFVNFDTVTTCFQPLTVQSVNHLFNHISAFNCGTIFDLSYGSNVSVDVGDFVGCNSDYLVKLGTTGSNGGGPNEGVNRFSNFKIDSPNKNFKLLRLRSWQKCEFESMTVNVTSDFDPSSICLVENGNVTFHACSFASGQKVVLFQEGPVPSATYRRGATFHDCNFGLPAGSLPGAGPWSACSLGIVVAPVGDTNTAYAFDKCVAWDGSKFLAPIQDCKYPTTGASW